MQRFTILHDVVQTESQILPSIGRPFLLSLVLHHVVLEAAPQAPCHFPHTPCWGVSLCLGYNVRLLRLFHSLTGKPTLESPVCHLLWEVFLLTSPSAPLHSKYVVGQLCDDRFHVVLCPLPFLSFDELQMP